MKLHHEKDMYTLFVSVTTSWMCVYIDLHLPAQIYIMRISCICMELPYNTHLKTICLHRMTLL